MLYELGQREIMSVLLEGGSTLNYSLLESGLVDKVYFFIAPLVFGGATAPTPVGGLGKETVEEAWQVTDLEVSRCDSDILAIGYINYMNRDKGGVSCVHRDCRRIGDDTVDIDAWRIRGLGSDCP